MRGHTTRREEREILDLLRESAAETLNYVLQNISLEKLFGDIDDHLTGPKHKTELLRLLSRERVQELAIPTRAGVIDGLQRGHTSSRQAQDQGGNRIGSGREERAIRDVFLATTDLELTELKNRLDEGADHYDLHHLLHHDLDNPVYRAQIQLHLREHSASDGRPRLKALSDIDDTFYVNWKDRRYPSETVYPGVLQFYDELDRGPGEPDRMGDLAFLTARPEERIGWIKDRAHRTLREKGVREATVLAGSVPSLIDNEAIARKKFQNFEEYAALYPEYRFVFTGDSGQGDAILGARMVREHPDIVQGVFIHDVVGLTPEQREQMRLEGIEVFDTYVGAGIAAYQKGLIGADGLRRVAQAAERDMAAISFESPEQREARLRELTRDLDRMSEVLAPVSA
ncbi:MAG: DUF2183 domain-containing protein [Armatimonadetes bacterium]|nr:DUF2183 domain-containing protein [Armatimonadota bacterium]